MLIRLKFVVRGEETSPTLTCPVWYGKMAVLFCALGRHIGHKEHIIHRAQENSHTYTLVSRNEAPTLSE